MKRLLFTVPITVALLPVTAAFLLMQRGLRQAGAFEQLESFMQEYEERLDNMLDVFPEEEE